MAELRLLEFKYSKDYRIAFEDMVTLMFCTELGLSHGVNRRTGQKAIESDPVYKDGKVYAYQAKYYEAATALSEHTKDLMKSIEGAADEEVTDLYFFINKSLPRKNKNTGNEASYIYRIEKHAADRHIKLHWRTLKQIEDTLDMPAYQYIRELYFGSPDKTLSNYRAFYEDIFKKASDDSRSTLYGKMSLLECYIETEVSVDGTSMTVHEYLDAWAAGDETIAIICGEPGHGKTSLSLKAVCAFYKEGWLADKVNNVFCFSLNPAKTDALANNSFDLYPLLSWGNNRKDRKHILSEEDCKDALIFLDGFDELLEWYPKFNLRSFIENEVLPFQEETGAHIIITTRNMAVDSDVESYQLSNGSVVPVRKLQPISREKQLDWIQLYTAHCRECLPRKAGQLEAYFRAYSKLPEDDDMNTLLGIPSIFRLIVDAEYLPQNGQSITQVYDSLFHITWARHRKSNSTEEDEADTRKKLQNHALNIYLDNNDTAEAEASGKSAWLFSFYTMHEGKKRVGFLHRSFYQYFLAKEVLDWYKEYLSRKDEEELRRKMAYLARRCLDRTTLGYIKEIFEHDEDRELLCESFEKVYEILKETDGILPLPEDPGRPNEMRKVVPIRRANNVFWNVVSVGSICGQAVTKENTNIDALQIYDLGRCILSNAQLEGVDLRGANLYGAELKHVCLHRANLNGVELRKADLTDADLSSAELNEANLEFADLSRASLWGTALCQTNFGYADLRDTDFREADLRGIKLEGVKLNDCDFKRTKLDPSNAGYLESLGIDTSEMMIVDEGEDA